MAEQAEPRAAGAPSSAAQMTALFAAAACVFLGNGLLTTLVSVRAAQDGFGDFAIGLVGGAFFLGAAGGAMAAPGVIGRVGHIRAFAAFASLSSAATLAFPFAVAAPVWIALRLAQGVCHAGLVIVAESWINAGAASERRGRLLALYGLVNYAAWGASQPLFALAPAQGFGLFALVSAALSVALVPVTLTRAGSPGVVAAERSGLRRLFAISPVALIGVGLLGLAMGAFWGLAPSYAERKGLTEPEISAFLTAPLIGALAMQWALGWLSDRVERRVVIGLAAAGAALVAAALGLEGAFGARPPLVLAAALGGLAMPLYAVCVAHANDRVAAAELVPAASGLVMVYGVGAGLGPPLAGALMALLGPEALFPLIAAGLGAIAVAAFGRRLAVAPAPAQDRERFVSAPATSHAALALHPQGSGAPDRPAAPR